MFIPAIDAVPSEFEVLDFEDEYNVNTLLAVSPDQTWLIGVLTSLIPFTEDDELRHEFQFGISVNDLEGYEYQVIMECDPAKNYLPTEVRPLVMPCVCGATAALIERVQPAVISRVTKATHPPEKALHKHHMITDTLVGLGYSIALMDTNSIGRVEWLLVKEEGDSNG